MPQFNVLASGAGVLEQKDGANPQEFRVYGTTTGPLYVRLFHDGTNAGLYTIAGAGSLYFGTNGAARWLVQNTTGHFLSSSDNAVDIGASSSNRPRTGYFGTSIVVGPAEATTYGGTKVVALYNTIDFALTLRQTTSEVELVLSTSGQASIYTSTNQRLLLGTNNTSRWDISASGHLLAFADAAYNIGAAGATRPANVYVATSVSVGTNPSTTGAVNIGNNLQIAFRNAANTADITFGKINSANELSLGNGGDAGIIMVSGANLASLIRGANPQEFRVYGTTTGPKYLSLKHDGANGIVDVADSSGELILGPTNASDIRWGKGLVTLGGGAVPTLGTIGGSGPATAAQNSWMRVIDSTGAAFWVPTWK